MPDVLTDEALRQITARNEATADGMVTADDLCAQDRHTLLTEVVRLRGVVAQLRQGRPIASI